MQQTRTTEDCGNIWSDNHQLRAVGVRDLSVGIAAYTRRRPIRKPVVETTTVPEIPQDAA